MRLNSFGISATWHRLFFLTACSVARAAEPPVPDASGIARHQGELLIVGDRAVGKLFRADIAVLANHSAVKLTQHNTTSTTFQSPMAIDLEAVDTFTDGTWAVVSERSRGLALSSGQYVEYPPSMAEIGGVGLEGLSISADNVVAGLWEGGFPDMSKLPPDQARSKNVAYAPQLCVHRLPKETGVMVCEGGVTLLDVPAAPESDQVFRAPDLVWENAKSLIVLLSSTNSTHTKFRFKWLQRFSLQGVPTGEPLNLCDKGVLPIELRRTNIEGIDWFEAGQSLIMVNDGSQATYAFTLEVATWPKTDKSVPCD
ncbi:MAG: hypothetical protein JNN30_12960 [Rhodanobacteraceae bacterium]|nr:hypothetical protein [Rhodanobacteraceae bacterium]